jgi:hypothetical protein
MNEFKISLERLERSELISHSRCLVELRRVGAVAFAIKTRDDGQWRFTFTSAALAKFLEKLETSILDVRLLSQTPIVGDESDETKILRLRLGDAKIIILNKYDHLYEYEPSTNVDPRGKLISPVKLWGLPPLSHAGRMLITERMATLIENLAEEGQFHHLIFVLWRDYQLAVNDITPNENDVITVEGEFMTFSVRPFAFEMLIFDLA